MWAFSLVNGGSVPLQHLARTWGGALARGNPLALVSDAPDYPFEFPVVAFLGGCAERAVPPPPEDDAKNCHRGKQRTDKDQDDHAYLSAGSEI